LKKTGYSNSTGFHDERGHILNWKFINVQSPAGEIKLIGEESEHAFRKVVFMNCCQGGMPLEA